MDGILITARLKSTRLLRKVLLKVLGKPILQYQIERLRYNVHDKEIILCTSTNPQDEELLKFAENIGLKYYCGAEEDVLKRYLEACNNFGIQRMYIIYGDEPFIDIETLNDSFSKLVVGEKIFIDNSDLPDGTFGYGMTYDAIKYINQEKNSDANEVWGKMVSKMSISILKNKQFTNVTSSNYRFTIDYPEDLTVFQAIIDEIGEKFKTISLNELMQVYDKKELILINGGKIQEYYSRIDKQGNI